MSEMSAEEKAEYVKARRRRWLADNRVRAYAASKKWRQENRDYVNARRRLLRDRKPKRIPRTAEENRAWRRERAKLYYKQNKEIILKKSKQYQARKREAIRKQRRRFFLKNRERILEASRKRYYRLKREGKLPIRRYKDLSTHQRLRQTLVLRTRAILIRFMSTSNPSRRSVSQLIGCYASELAAHLEKGFYPHPDTGQAMSWLNYGRGYGRWNVDHIIPLNQFDLNIAADVDVACHFSNLQPLWEIHNQLKGGRKLTNEQVFREYEDRKRMLKAP